MIGFVYCRVAPNNNRVARSDRIFAQMDRCLKFAEKHNLNVTRQYADQGYIHPTNLTPALKNMLGAIRNNEELAVVLVDHLHRLGVNFNTRSFLVNRIEYDGGIVLPLYGGGLEYFQKYTALKNWRSSQ